MITRSVLQEAKDPKTNPERLKELSQEKALLVRRRLAQNGSLPGVVADKIFWPCDNVLWRSLAKNPSTPGRLLPKLSERFADEVLSNPALPLALLEDPGLLDRSSLRYFLLQAKSASPEMLATAAQSEGPAYRRLAAKHEGTPPALLARLAIDWDPNVRREAHRNPKTPKEIFAEIEHYRRDKLNEEEWRAASQHEYLREILAENETLSDAQVVSLFEAGAKKVKQKIAQREQLPEKIFEAKDDHSYWFELLLSHPQAPKEFVERFFREIHFGPRKGAPQRHRLANSPHLTKEMIDQLVENDIITEKMMLNPLVAEEHLQKILLSINIRGIHNSDIRSSAAKHPNAPRWLLLLMQRAGFDATTGEYREDSISLSPEDEAKMFELGAFTRGLLLRCPNIKGELLDKLFQKELSPPIPFREGHEFIYLNRALSQNRQFDAALLSKYKEREPLAKVIFESPTSTPAMLFQLWSKLQPYKAFEGSLKPKDESEVFDCLSRAYYQTIRLIAARNIHLPERLRARMVSDPFYQVRAAIAERSDVSSAQLSALLQDNKPEVRAAAAKNPNASQTFLSLLRRCGASLDLTEFAPPDLSISPNELHRLSRKGYFPKILAVRHPNTPASALHKLSLAQPDIASYVMCHPNTSEETLLSIARKKYEALHLALLKRPQPLSDEVLFALLSSASKEVRRLTAKRPEAKELVELFLWVGASDDFSGPHPPQAVPPLHPRMERAGVEVLTRFANAGIYGQQLAARHPNTSPEILQSFLVSLRASLRALAAQNPSSPKEVIALLQKVGASEDLTEIETPDEKISEEEWKRAEALGPFGALLVSLALSI